MILFCVEFTNLARTYMAAQTLFLVNNAVPFLAHSFLALYYTPGIKCTEVNPSTNKRHCTCTSVIVYRHCGHASNALIWLISKSFSLARH